MLSLRQKTLFFFLISPHFLYVCRLVFIKTSLFFFLFFIFPSCLHQKSLFFFFFFYSSYLRISSPSILSSSKVPLLLISLHFLFLSCLAFIKSSFSSSHISAFLLLLSCVHQKLLFFFSYLLVYSPSVLYSSTVPLLLVFIFMAFVSFSLTAHPTYAFPLATGFGASRLATVLCCSKNGGEYGGLFGASGGSNAFQLCEKAMQSLKHRGEREICIATGGEGVLTRTLNRKLNDEDQPRGFVGIASCSNHASNVVLSEDAMVALAFVGNILNYSVLKKSLPHEKMIGDSHSELILHLLISSSSVLLETRVLGMCEAIQGEFCLLMIADGWLIAARSPRGMFPLVKGKSSSDTTIFGTEASCVDSLGYYDREIFPGEILMVKNGVQKSFNMIRKLSAKHCLMEQIYLRSQETKEAFNRSVDHFRMLIASRLVLKGDEEPDVILVASDASIKIAGAYSVATGIPFGGRVFAFDTEFLNKFEMSEKIEEYRKAGNFHPRGLFSGHRILLFDDGRVVSKCSERILESLRSYTCATEVHLKLICPEIRSACPYGVNLKSMGYTEETEAYVKQYDSCSRIYAGDLKTFILKKDADQYCLQCMQEQKEGHYSST